MARVDFWKQDNIISNSTIQLEYYDVSYLVKEVTISGIRTVFMECQPEQPQGFFEKDLIVEPLFSSSFNSSLQLRV